MSDAPAAAPDEAAPTPEPPSMHGCPLTDSCGQTVLHPSRQQYVGVVRALLDEGYEMCVDLTVTDYLLTPQRTAADGVATERFEVVFNLLS
jgi:NADH-quinone oxidoreductase subunit C